VRVILVEDYEQDQHLILAQIAELDKQIIPIFAGGLADAKTVIAAENPNVALLDLGLGPTHGLRTLLDFPKHTLPCLL
jgi:response regulator of citrate/malate metabolism